MEKIKSNLTNNIIAVIISLMTIIGAGSGFVYSQAKLEVQLTDIQKDLVEIKIALKEEEDKRDEEIKCLTERIIKLEERLEERGN